MTYLCYDTAINEEYTLMRLLELYPQHISLFHGTDDERIWDAAPYLFEVKNNFYSLRNTSPLIRLEHCIVFQTAETLIETTRFLQAFCYKNIKDRPQYFRIWDARILLNSFSKWETSDQQKFFDFFTCFYTGGEDWNYFNKWELGPGNFLLAQKILKTDVLIQTNIRGETTANKIINAAESDSPAILPPPIISGEKAAITPPSKKRRFFID